MFCFRKPGLKKEDLIESLSHCINQEKEVRFLEPCDESVATEVLADAFLNDPMMKWIAGLDGSDPDGLEKMLKLVTWIVRALNRFSFGKSNGVLLGAKEGSEMAGVMNIIPSSGREPNLLDWIIYSIKNRYPLQEEGYSPHSQKRIEALDAIISTKKKEFTKEYPNHIYLKMVGVRGNAQNKGVGGRMFRPLFGAADSLGVPIYLETESKENEAMYMHYGFETREIITVVAKGDTSTDAKFLVYLMARMPK